jgi:hypothetical protein
MTNVSLLQQLLSSFFSKDLVCLHCFDYTASAEAAAEEQEEASDQPIFRVQV